MKHLFFITITVLVTLWSCNNAEKATTTNKGDWSHAGVIAEVIQTSNYTYLELEEDGAKYWIAIPKSDLKSGQTVYYNSGLPMTNFESKELNRTFDKVLFVQVISDKATGESEMAPMERAKINKSGGTKKNVEITPLEGGLTLEEVYRDSEQLNGKEILVKGIVTKYNPAIMNKNWLHIQDGTEGEGAYDLTITTNDETKVGEVVIFKGTLNLNRDFGAGYTYDVILEDAVLQREM